MSFRRRTFPEVLDNLLTDIVGGVAAESHPFPPVTNAPPPFRYHLEQPPVAAVVSVYGSRDGQAKLLREDADWHLLDDRQTLELLQGAELPDPGTLLHVNYLPRSAKPELTDLQVGSVVRTLAESFGLELARLYAQLEVVYRAGFIDTATGSSLDNVVALLGISRVTGGRAAGEIQFTRAAGTRGTISILAGTRVMTADGEVEYATVETVTMLESQNTIRVVARDVEPNEPLPADALVVLPVAIQGVAGVTNPAPTAIAAQDESDDELRSRAKSFLHGSERATLGALRGAIARQQVTVDIEELVGTPGVVEYTLQAETIGPELEQRILKAIEETRPAGVMVKPKGGTAFVVPTPVDLTLRLTTGDGLPEQEVRAAQRAVRDRITDYFAHLLVREKASINRIVGVVLGVPQVTDVRLVAATVDGTDVVDAAAGALNVDGVSTVLGELHLADPALPTLLSVTVSFPEASAAPDRQAINAAVSTAVAYLNDLNAHELPAPTPQDIARRTVSFGKLLRVVPLPAKPGAPLPAFDDAAPGTVVLPTAASVAPYVVRVTLAQASGLARILEGDTDAYALTPFERLSVSNIEVDVVAPDE